MSFEDQNIQVSVTEGTEKYSDDLTVDKWISGAGAKLYEGKKSGKNKVVY